MLREEFLEVETALSRVKKTSKVFQVIVRVTLICFTVFWGILLLAISLSLLSSPILPDSINADASMFSFVLVHGVITWLLLKILLDIFNDVVNGDSPFTIRQVKRFRIVAILFFASALFEAVFSVGFVPVMQAGQIDVNYVDSSIPGPNISINIGNLFCTFIFFSLSYVFKYGVLLQEFSDETI